jgi:hypothetical protein
MSSTNRPEDNLQNIRRQLDECFWTDNNIASWLIFLWFGRGGCLPGDFFQHPNQCFLFHRR